MSFCLKRLSIFMILLFASTSSMIANHAIPVYASNSSNWRVDVDAPIHYTSKFSTGEHGVLIRGVQKNVAKGSNISYEIVKKGIWEDKKFDKVKISDEREFSARLQAPRGNDYYILIYGFGNLSTGKLKIEPF